MLVLMAFIMILKKVNIRSIKNGIKELRMTKQELIEKYTDLIQQVKLTQENVLKHPERFGGYEDLIKYQHYEEMLNLVLTDLEKLD